MARQIAWVAVLLVGATGVALLLVALLFVPVERWEAFVPLATLVAVLGAVITAVVVERTGWRLVRPLRQLTRSIESGHLNDLSLDDLGRQAPPEVAPLLYGLQLTHTRLQRILGQLEQDRAEVATIFEHMADSVVVLDGQDRVVLSNPAAERMLGAPIGLDRPELLGL